MIVTNAQGMYERLFEMPPIRNNPVFIIYIYRFSAYTINVIAYNKRIIEYCAT